MMRELQNVGVIVWVSYEGFIRVNFLLSCLFFRGVGVAIWLSRSRCYVLCVCLIGVF
jgi:hypothetical protein